MSGGEGRLPVPQAQPLRTGDPVRLGGYELAGRLGEGGQGTVYLGVRAEDVGLRAERYAVKLLHQPVGDDEAAFLREVELAKQVARFCTAQVVDAGVAEGRPYIVSEYVDGPSLHRDVAVAGPRSEGALERLAIGTATALAAIHRAGIVHRDFKPQNVLLGPDGPRVIDFGLARALDASATLSGRGAGTPAYMAPEQVEGRHVTAAADVFAWAATICFAATGQAPFGQDSIAAVLHRILTARPDTSQVPGRLGELVERCLAKDPADRPTSRDLLLALLGEPADLPGRAPTPRDSLLEAAASAAVPLSSGPGSSGSSGASGSFGASAPSGSSVSRSPVSAPSVASAERTHPGRAATRVSMAVSGALLVSAAVLVAVLVPALTSADERRGGGDGTAKVTAAPSGPAAGERTGPAGEETIPEVAPPQPARRAAPPVTSQGPATVTVPELLGLDRAGALRALKRAGLVAGPVTQVDSDKRIGRVLAAEPAPGTAVATGSRVSLSVSAGLKVPPVVGLQRRAATAAITSAGLTVGGVTRMCTVSAPAGQVLSSTPAAGTRVAGGAAVALEVAQRGVPVPSVVGGPRAEARRTLSAAGFTVRLQGQVVQDQQQVDAVLAQSVGAGVCAKEGAIVVLTVGIEGSSGPGESPGPDPEDPDGGTTDDTAGEPTDDPADGRAGDPADDTGTDGQDAVEARAAAR
ncbi:serine/threonine protein kinase/beta-lactam-binding protein with PASTA domain [Thermocatellispora tengchongensis]|uniref:non-specific serine/threonine protein kinase n=1 Tax=Thermocatellispora tengchongensis TaxID=1073253 RepID=A0A840PBA8_9ACTN|nr:PASTA domain-containing protein [Thermocatellispora tengchongensis]MBB5133285.1 serine/threonine protein kinase/beta-lactam-binding protein with PASTA domain [Thermocatellispora tengchongensis]